MTTTEFNLALARIRAEHAVATTRREIAAAKLAADAERTSRRSFGLTFDVAIGVAIGLGAIAVHVLTIGGAL